jgi:hypothetical protein
MPRACRTAAWMRLEPMPRWGWTGTTDMGPKARIVLVFDPPPLSNRILDRSRCPTMQPFSSATNDRSGTKFLQARVALTRRAPFSHSNALRLTTSIALTSSDTSALTMTSRVVCSAPGCNEYRRYPGQGVVRNNLIRHLSMQSGIRTMENYRQRKSTRQGFRNVVTWPLSGSETLAGGRVAF